MTPETIGFGWFLLTAALLTLGPLTIWWVRRDVQAEADRRAVRAMDAENAAWVSHPEPTSLDAHADQSVALAAHTQAACERLPVVANSNVVPIQRDGRWS